jgi:hypothetical protein
MPLHIYAEHLINIRTLTIQSTLPSPSNETTACTLSAHGHVLTLTHQGETASIALPVAVPAHASTSIIIPTIPTKDLSFRVRLEYDDTLQDRQSSETIIPWTAASLSHTVGLRCKNCRAVILPQGKIQTWKDLPSEGWAEMMEFWHCHKPNEPHNHEQQTDKKGYSAESKLAITPSVGLVNATSFILAAADCDNIKVGELISLPFEHLVVHSGTEKNRRFSAARLLYMEDSGYCCPKANLFFAAWNLLQPLRKLWVLWRSNAPYFLRSHRPVPELMGVADISAQIHTQVLYGIYNHVFPLDFFPMYADVSPAQMPEHVEDSNANADLECSSCNTIVGILDATTLSYKMAKLALAVAPNISNLQSFDMAKWLSCHLLSSMDNEGLRKFTISSASGAQRPILIWIFAPDLNVASSASQQDTPLRVVKVMWKPAPAHVQNAWLDTQSMTEGEIVLPAFEFAALSSSLEECAVLLPEGSRQFLDWNVALLERFTVEDASLP